MNQPSTCSAPITSHFDSILECLDFLEMSESDTETDKKEVINGMKSRLNNMVSKVLVSNSITSMSMQGWKLT